LPTLDTKIDELAAKKQAPPSWIWAALGGLIFMFSVWWLKYLLSKKADELSKAKTELETMKIKAQQAAVAAQVESETAKRKAAEDAAREAANRVSVDEKVLAAAETEYRKSKAKLDAVADQDWASLNKMAGVR